MSESASQTTLESLRTRWVQSAPVVVNPRAEARRRQIRARHRLMTTDGLMLALTGFLVLAEEAAGVIDAAVEPWALAFPLVTYVMLGFKRMHRPRITPALLDDLRGVVASAAVAAMGLTFLVILINNNPNAAEASLAAWLTASVMLGIGRALLVLTEFLQWRRGGGSPTLIIGAGRIGHLVSERMLACSGGLRPIAFVDDEPLPGLPSELPVIRGDELERFVADHEVQHAIFAFSNDPPQTQLKFSERLDELGIPITVIPRLFEGVRDQMSVERMGGLPLVSMFPTPPTSWRFGVKYAIDRLVALTILMILSPLLLLVAIAVMIDLGRPVFYRQARIGRDGDPFEMLKFRSMRDAVTTSESDEHSWKSLEGAFKQGLGPGGVEGNGDRRSKLGALLRRTSIDELPQLINVLRGDMSLVGPRPERPLIVERFEQQFHRYNDRHRVRPGITGWAQVNGLRGRTSISDRVEWDNYYVENWSPWLDLKIVCLTLLALVRDRPE